ncbi:MFS transporter [Streptomyces sp. NPDC048416]|uniref:MFS transporter n=1 Tax=Streptomyces sp. NPDC048416 TaxID=3365546 RepID=UPI00371C8B29
MRGTILATLALAPARFPAAGIAGLTLIVGLGEAVFVPAYTAVLKQVAPPSELQSANALTAMARNGAQVAGPVLAGAMVAGAGAQAALTADAATFAVSVVTLAVLVRHPFHSRQRHDSSQSNSSSGRGSRYGPDPG